MAAFETLGKLIQDLKLKHLFKKRIFKKKSKKNFYQINPKEKFEIPKSFECDFPLRSNNADYDSEVEKHSFEWAIKFGLMSEEKVIKRIKSAKYSLFGCYVFPTAPFDRLCLGTDFMFWLFFLDDQVDDKLDLSGEPEKLKKALDGLLLVINSDHFPDSNKYPIAVSLWDLWSRMKCITGKVWQQRFRTSLANYFNAYYIHAQNCVSKKVHNSVDDYVELRRYTGAAEVSFNLVEITRNLELSDDVYSDPKFQCVFNYCNDHACFVNDIYSLRKELLVNGTDNLIVVLKNLNNYSLQEAVNDAAKLSNLRVTQIQENISKLPDFGPEMNKAVNSYFEGVKDFLSGSFYWHQITPRYAVEDKKQMESYLELILAP
ncbi:21365_t:CDS:1 [Cetraspora pellucida]|uniref:Terpene synthase n=1 Tax=Cetraspora pellucida TaxID=1433469 RepID=A0A9N9NL16_9GLOM|nr:21365_t:CDS:1 [Cetraspora pellucida]